MREVLFAITSAHAGAAIVLDDEGRMIGFIADGDIRRQLLEGVECLERPVSAIMKTSPRVCAPQVLITECLEIMQNTARGIGEMPVVGEDGRPLGMLNLKDILRAGIF